MEQFGIFGKRTLQENSDLKNILGYQTIYGISYILSMHKIMFSYISTVWKSNLEKLDFHTVGGMFPFYNGHLEDEGPK